jgi:hypothetical protein
MKSMSSYTRLHHPGWPAENQATSDAWMVFMRVQIGVNSDGGQIQARQCRSMIDTAYTKSRQLAHNIHLRSKIFL